jgi:hypothetical protein
MALTTTTTHSGTLQDVIAHLEAEQQRVGKTRGDKRLRELAAARAEGVGLALDVLRVWTPTDQGAPVIREVAPIRPDDPPQVYRPATNG